MRPLLSATLLFLLFFPQLGYAQKQRIVNEVRSENAEVVRLIKAREFAEAMIRAQEVFEKAEDELGPEHPYTLDSAANLGKVYERGRRHDKAEALYKRVLKATLRLFGREHERTSLALQNLAAVYLAKGNIDEAQKLFKRLVETDAKIFGPDHLQTLNSTDFLAKTYLKQGHVEKAEKLHKKAHEIRKRVLGADDPRTLRSTTNLAMFYQNTGRYREAKPIYERALKRQERVLGKEHSLTAWSRRQLAAFESNKPDSQYRNRCVEWFAVIVYSDRSAAARKKRVRELWDTCLPKAGYDAGVWGINGNFDVICGTNRLRSFASRHHDLVACTEGNQTADQFCAMEGCITKRE
jgi:tetratricopeptide (TPR) repeat protein